MLFLISLSIFKHYQSLLLSFTDPLELVNALKAQLLSLKAETLLKIAFEVFDEKVSYSLLEDLRAVIYPQVISDLQDAGILPSSTSSPCSPSPSPSDDLESSSSGQPIPDPIPSSVSDQDLDAPRVLPTSSDLKETGLDPDGSSSDTTTSSASESGSDDEKDDADDSLSSDTEIDIDTTTSSETDDSISEEEVKNNKKNNNKERGSPSNTRRSLEEERPENKSGISLSLTSSRGVAGRQRVRQLEKGKDIHPRALMLRSRTFDIISTSSDALLRHVQNPSSSNLSSSLSAASYGSTTSSSTSSSSSSLIQFGSSPPKSPSPFPSPLPSPGPSPRQGFPSHGTVPAMCSDRTRSSSIVQFIVSLSKSDALVDPIDTPPSDSFSRNT